MNYKQWGFPQQKQKIMTQEELKEKFYSLYDFMANSDKPDNMKAFGKVMCEMMEQMIANHPSQAEEYIDKLCAIKWQNYLTKNEAGRIINDMTPKAPWSYEVWENAVKELTTEKQPYFNKYALFVTMNMIMSDSSDTLAKYIAKEDMLNAVYELAIDKLCDEDENFSVRRYFKL